MSCLELKYCLELILPFLNNNKIECIYDFKNLMLTSKKIFSIVSNSNCWLINKRIKIANIIFDVNNIINKFNTYNLSNYNANFKNSYCKPYYVTFLFYYLTFNFNRLMFSAKFILELNYNKEIMKVIKYAVYTFKFELYTSKILDKSKKFLKILKKSDHHLNDFYKIINHCFINIITDDLYIAINVIKTINPSLQTINDNCGFIIKNMDNYLYLDYDSSKDTRSVKFYVNSIKSSIKYNKNNINNIPICGYYYNYNCLCKCHNTINKHINNNIKLNFYNNDYKNLSNSIKLTINNIKSNTEMCFKCNGCYDQTMTSQMHLETIDFRTKIFLGELEPLRYDTEETIYNIKFICSALNVDIQYFLYFTYCYSNFNIPFNKFIQIPCIFKKY